MRIHAIAVPAVAAVLLLAGCSSGSSSDTTAKPTTTSATTTSQPTAAADPVKLSTTWSPKLEALAAGAGTKGCSTDSGGADCIQGISDSVDLFTQITEAISTAGAADEYPLTVAKITELVGDADTYTKDECPGDENADVDGSPCPKSALAVTVGVTALEFVMQTDEANAGA